MISDKTKIIEFEKIFVQELLHEENSLIRYRLSILLDIYREHFNLKKI